jgi:multidrug efflux pump subunit AcrB
MCATFAYTSTALPMPTAELAAVAVVVAGLVPIGLNDSATCEHNFSLFAIIASSLLISRVVTVLFARLFGATVLPKSVAKRGHRP